MTVFVSSHPLPSCHSTPDTRPCCRTCWHWTDRNRLCRAHTDRRRSQRPRWVPGLCRGGLSWASDTQLWRQTKLLEQLANSKRKMIVYADDVVFYTISFLTLSATSLQTLSLSFEVVLVAHATAVLEAFTAHWGGVVVEVHEHPKTGSCLWS